VNRKSVEMVRLHLRIESVPRYAHVAYFRRENVEFLRIDKRLCGNFRLHVTALVTLNIYRAQYRTHYKMYFREWLEIAHG
jgi:hypothetical protein